MKKRVILLSALFVLAFFVPTQAAIKYINATSLDTEFTVSGGDFGLGILVIDDNADIIVEDMLGLQSPYLGGSFYLSTSLQEDKSTGGIAFGYFEGGTLSFLDESANALLIGSIDYLDLFERFDDLGIWGGSGYFEVTGGSLAAEFSETYGDIVQITFQVTPMVLGDLSSNFTGVSDITVTPIPEPVSVLILGLGALFLRKK